MGKELFLSAVKYCILKYSKKKRRETSFNLAVGSLSKWLLWHGTIWKNVPHVFVLVYKTFPDPAAVVPDA